MVLLEFESDIVDFVYLILPDHPLDQIESIEFSFHQVKCLPNNHDGFSFVVLLDLNCCC